MKKTLALILILMLTVCMCTSAFAASGNVGNDDLIVFKSEGEIVVRIQLRLRELGYFNYKPTGKYQSMSFNAAIKFQQLQTDANAQAIMADGTIGQQSKDILFSRSAVRTDITASIPIGESLSGAAVLTGKLIDWETVSGMLKVDGVYAVHDYNTGVTFNMKCVEIGSHAEMECATAEDTQIYKDAFGGEFNYSKRPVVVDIDSQQIAASLQGYPHGSDTVSGNDMDGHSCLYFKDSLSHVGSLPDVEHLNQVYKAAGRS